MNVESRDLQTYCSEHLDVQSSLESVEAILSDRRTVRS